ncbi:MAG: hypothetical protein EAX87_11640 [Candidatus Thorarchaeota archaeon]|nr:hypothetical protein [Candidatus Thorarchaeota archaeon]
MNAAERFLQVCGEIGNFTEKRTGVSVVDAYFGPDEFHPKKQSEAKTATDLVHDIYIAFDTLRDEVNDPLRFEYMMGELHSLNTVVDWLSGKELSYAQLVEGLFHIELKQFPEDVIDESIRLLESRISEFPGKDLRDKVTRFGSEGEVTGNDLKILIEKELQTKSKEVGELFRDRIFSQMGSSVPDKGVQYEAVQNQPWSGYNWYQGDFKSLNQFNIDAKFNKDTLLNVIYHEYEHHVSNLWREKAYINSQELELSIVPLHTGRCVISEGTADTAKEFLRVTDDGPRMQVAEALNALRRMTSINAAIMLNAKRCAVDETVDYLVNRGFRTEESAKRSINFISPTTKDGSINFFAPYIFTYFTGRTDFVLPMYKKAVEQDVLPEFFKTVYMNPYSGSSVTWRKAFEWM